MILERKVVKDLFAKAANSILLHVYLEKRPRSVAASWPLT
jgi:hypothetical protein